MSPRRSVATRRRERGFARRCRKSSRLRRMCARRFLRAVTATHPRAALARPVAPAAVRLLEATTTSSPVPRATLRSFRRRDSHAEKGKGCRWLLTAVPPFAFFLSALTFRHLTYAPTIRLRHLGNRPQQGRLRPGTDPQGQSATWRHGDAERHRLRAAG